MWFLVVVMAGVFSLGPGESPRCWGPHRGGALPLAGRLGVKCPLRGGVSWSQVRSTSLVRLGAGI